MYLLCITQADPEIRMTTQNPSRRPLSASRARSCPLSFGVQGWKEDVMLVISSTLSRQPGSTVVPEDLCRIFTLRSSCAHTSDISAQLYMSSAGGFIPRSFQPLSLASSINTSNVM